MTHLIRCRCRGQCGQSHGIGSCKIELCGSGICPNCQRGIDAKKPKRRALPRSPRMSDGFGDTPLFGGTNGKPII